MIVAVMRMMSVIVHTRVHALLKGDAFQEIGFHTTIGLNGPFLSQHHPMKHIPRTFALCLATFLGSLGPESQAASILEYRLKESGSPIVQQIEIQNGRAWIHGLGGDPEMDLLFDAQSGQWAVINRKRQSFTAFSEKSVRQLSEQLELVAPLVKGLGEQMGGLSADQRQQWGRLLENVPVEEINRLQKTAKKTKLVASGKLQRVAGIECRPFKVDSSATHLDFCLADSAAIALPEEDAKTLAKMTNSTQAMIQHAGSLSVRFGLNLAANDLAKISGLPVSFREGSAKSGLDIQFLGIKNPTEPLRSPDIPSGYHQEKIKLW